MRRLMMWNGTTFLLPLLLLITGCPAPKREASEEANPKVTQNSQASAEPTWAEAVAAVRSGESVEIRLKKVPVRDEQLADLEGLDTLLRLNLQSSQITDEGLALITKYTPDLELLRLGSPKLTDAGMEHLSKLKKLRFLHLIDVPITDAGLKPLEEMHWLESFYLDDDQATDEGLSQLLKALPELHFHRNQHHLPGDPHRDGH